MKIPLAFSLILTASLSCAQDHWPQFRGKESLGVAAGKNLPSFWSTTSNVAWSVEVPGSGWSSPIIWDNQVIVTTVSREGSGEAPRKGLYFGGERPEPPQDGHHWRVMAFDFATGKKLWDTEVHQGQPKAGIHIKNTYASETPVTDGKNIYAYFGNVGLYCLDLKGKVIWSKPFEFKKTRFSWGTAASPVLHGDRVYIVNDNEEDSYLMALNKKNGEEVFKISREEGSNWSTPYLWEHDKGKEIVTPGTKKVRSYDLDGNLLWELKGMSSITIMTPFSSHGLLYVTSGYVGDRNKPVYAIKPGARGDITLSQGETENAFIAWHQKTAAPYNPSPLVYGDYFYVLYDFGFFACYNAKTGELVYEKERLKSDGPAGFTASPWAYDGKIFCLSEDGDTYVVPAGPKFEVIAVNPLEEMCMATPAMARNRLVIRTAGKLYSIQQNGPKS